MKSNDIRKSFLDYFEGKGHSTVPSSGLLPQDDPTLLFTNAGMVQFKRVFLGEEKRPYSRAASSQKCLRAGGKHNDLENVGHTARHHTFFEMLGNFSFGDYFKEDAIKYAWEYLTVVLGLPEDKLWATVFEDDDEAEELWQTKTDISHDRIKRLGEADNFWSMGEVGPCGPCSEILIDQGEELGCDSPDCAVGCDCDRYLEIWNLVFMQLNKDADGKVTPLPRPSIDTGMGLERLTAVLQGKLNNYDTDLFEPIIKKIEELSGAVYHSSPETDSSIRAIADHARAVTFLISEGLLPSNEGRGYVLRRIIRRAARHGKLIGINKPFLFKVTGVVAEHMSGVFPELSQAKELVEKATFSEEEQFFKTLERGLGMLEEETLKLKKTKKTIISGEFAFKLYDTYGFPSDLTADIVRGESMSVDEAGFNKMMEAQKDKARLSWKGGAIGASGTELYAELLEEGINSEFVGYTEDREISEAACIIKDGTVVDKAAKGDNVEIISEKSPFYGESGGQAGDLGTISGNGFNVEISDTKRPLPDLIVHHGKVTEGTIEKGRKLVLAIDTEARDATRRNHTATHLLHAALRRALGEHVRQAGSLVNKDGLRFDFNHFNPLTNEEITKIEDDVNSAIRKNIAVTTKTLPYKEAVKRGALAFFGDKYGDEVRMVQVPEVSTELCGGTHVKMTGDIGLVKVTSESSVAAGVRRLEAVTGEAALRLLNQTYQTLTDAASLLKTTKEDVPNKIHRLIDKQKELEKELTRIKEHGKSESAKELATDVQVVAGVNVLAIKVGPDDAKDLRKMADLLRDKIKSGIVVLGCASNGKAVLLAAVTKDLTTRFSAGNIVKAIAPVVGGRGGGKADMAQAGGKDGTKIDAALKEALNIIKETAGEKV
ncbi:Alanyl-tRNA synthetase [hydrothermal vent metagenome]|uniref:Alanine--tRNA ligase n=1 Tax=hydrothermal vent metagenome TaxID=652676 RepID=A0A3B0QZC2_9ZZZZ